CHRCDNKPYEPGASRLVGDRGVGGSEYRPTNLTSAGRVPKVALIAETAGSDGYGVKTCSAKTRLTGAGLTVALMLIAGMAAPRWRRASARIWGSSEHVPATSGVSARTCCPMSDASRAVYRTRWASFPKVASISSST